MGINVLTVQKVMHLLCQPMASVCTHLVPDLGKIGEVQFRDIAQGEPNMGIVAIGQRTMAAHRLKADGTIRVLKNVLERTAVALTDFTRT